MAVRLHIVLACRFDTIRGGFRAINQAFLLIFMVLENQRTSGTVSNERKSEPQIACQRVGFRPDLALVLGRERNLFTELTAIGMLGS